MDGFEHEIGILFEYVVKDDVTINNLASFERMNPGVPLIPICTGAASECIPGSFHVSECGPLGKRWSSVAVNSVQAWRNCDLPYLAWYSSDRNTLSCRRWILVEYDVFCAIGLAGFIAPTLHAEVVAASITLPNRESQWEWFREMRLLPAHLRPFANGVVPIAGVILSDRAMRRICACYLEETTTCICELRLGTIANYLGFTPVPNSHPAARKITWQPHAAITAEQALWHPVKHVVRPH